MKYIPWRQVQSWQCLACGACCSTYRVELRKEEAQLIGQLWPKAVVRRSRAMYLGKVRRKCIFQFNRFCSLQSLGLKPLACKLWPFHVSALPISNWETNGWKSLFILEEKEYFVYVKPTCNGLNRGRPEDFKKVITEIIGMYSNPHSKQYLTTFHRKGIDKDQEEFDSFFNYGRARGKQ